MSNTTTVGMMIRIPVSLKRAIETRAREEGVSLSKWATQCFEQRFDSPVEKLRKAGFVHAEAWATALGATDDTEKEGEEQP
jgi:hypothetical protein